MQVAQYLAQTLDDAPKKKSAVRGAKYKYIHKDNIDIEIKKSVKKAQKYIRRTMVDNDRNLHKALVCVVYDVEITGTERVCHASRGKLLENKDRLSAQRYNENFGDKLDPLLVKQYEVDDLSGLLLSPRSSKHETGKYVACSHCYSSLSKHNSQNENPPKHAIANDLAIGYIPEILDI